MAALIMLTIKASIMLMVFALGLETRSQDLTYLVGRPGLLAKSMLSIYVVVPLATALMMAALTLKPMVEVALIALSVSPIPPLLPKKTAKTSGNGSYGVGLLVVVALASIVVTPLLVHVEGAAFGKSADFSFLAVATVIGQMVIAPLAAGLLVARFARGLAERIGKPISRFAPILMVVAVAPLLFKAAPGMLSLVGNGTLTAIAAFILVGLAAGHVLGGPEPSERTVLAIASSSRHPGIAIAIVGANFDNPKPATAAILLYLLMNIVVALPYRLWRKHVFGDAEHAPGAPATVNP